MSKKSASEDSWETTFRIEQRTHRILKDLVQKMDQCDSVKEFAENSIELHSNRILQMSTGGEQLREIVDLLADLEGIEAEDIEVELEARLGKGDLERTLYVELDVKTRGIINEIADNTGMSRSAVHRMCLFRRVFKIADNPATPIDYDWQARLLISRWIDIRNGLAAVYSQFHEILHRRFSLQTDETRYLIKNSHERFSRFAVVYWNELYDTELYNRLKEDHGERAFTDTENMIEEMVDIQSKPKDTAFMGPKTRE